MKNIYKIIFSFFILISSLQFNGCDPFEDFLIKLSLDTEFNLTGFGSTVLSPKNEICLSEFDDYSDNQDEIEEISYITSAYTILSATAGLRGDNLKLRLYQNDRTTLLADFDAPNFVAANYIDNPLEIKFTQQEVDNINRYLSNHKINNCFYAELEISNVQPSLLPYQLNSKVEFLTELKVKP